MIIEHAYVKQSFSLAWDFFRNNQIASLFVVTILLLLSLATRLPTIGMLFFLLLGVLSFSIQFFVAKNLLENLQETSFNEILLKYFKLAIGAFLGQVSIELLLGGLGYFMVSALVGMEAIEALQAGSLAQNLIYPVYMKLGFIVAVYFLIVMLWIYIVPMTLAYTYEAENFWEAFFAAFVLFSMPIWKASFKEKYYVLTSMLQVVAFLVFVCISLAFSNIVLIPLAVFCMYLFLIYIAVVSSMAKSAVS